MEVPGADRSVWLSYNQYVFDREVDQLMRYPFKSQVVRLSDGREIELAFGFAREFIEQTRSGRPRVTEEAA